MNARLTWVPHGLTEQRSPFFSLDKMGPFL
jgi:hypothetical protein